MLVEAAANTPSAMADQDLVKGILVNLLENAAEAAGEGGQDSGEGDADRRPGRD